MSLFFRSIRSQERIESMLARGLLLGSRTWLTQEQLTQIGAKDD
jgi:hypothetical protein